MPVVLPVIRKSQPWLRPVSTDGGYPAPKLERALTKIGDRVIEIPKKSDTTEGFEVILRRWFVERPLYDWDATAGSPRISNISSGPKSPGVLIVRFELLARCLANT